jgi:hypothetical protein
MFNTKMEENIPDDPERAQKFAAAGMAKRQKKRTS